MDATIEDAAVYWDPEQPRANVDEVHSVIFWLPANDEVFYDFDFCVSNIRALVR